MTAVPSGTIIFVFTDVEASTRLWGEDPDAMSASLQIHDRQVREAIEDADGYVFATAGDSFAAAFERATQAVDAVGSIQAGLAAADWGDGPELRVRIGLHLGEAEERGGDYFGPAVNTAARIAAAGHGGQVLASGAVVAAAGIDARDLGEHRLRDIAGPVHVFQVDGGDHPPLRTIDATRSTLPAQRSSFVGRADEVAEVRRALAAGRLVSVCGPGGIGKTRLALEAAHRELPAMGTAWFVDLAPVEGPGAITDAFVSGCELPVGSGAAVWDQVLGHLQGRPCIVVVDNCEHLVDEAAARVDQVLDKCPEALVIATSREPLDVDGERVLRLAPLASGDTESAGVRLFVERAAAAAPDADINASTDGVVELCERLEGLPLAIELAAARCRTFGPVEISEQVAARLDVLTGGRRRSARQRSLDATVAWSYHLLDHRERALLRFLSVFPADFDIGAAAAVAALPAAEAPAHVDSLVAKSLVLASPSSDGTRFRLLDTIRTFAADRLGEEPDAADSARQRHFEHFDGALPADASTKRSLATFVMVGAERANYRAALEWGERTGRPLAMASLAARLYGLWWGHAVYDDGLRWLRKALEVPGIDLATRGAILNGIGIVAGQVHSASSEEVFAEAITTGGSSLEDNPDLAWTYAFTAFAAAGLARSELARQLLSAGEQLVRRGDATSVQRGTMRWARGAVRQHERDFEPALADLAEAVELIAEGSPDHELVAWCGLLRIQGLHILGRSTEAGEALDRFERAFPWLPPIFHAYAQNLAAVVAASVAGDADRERRRLLATIDRGITHRTPNLTIWLGAFGCLAEMAGEAEIARGLLAGPAASPTIVQPLHWDHLRRASGWTEAELRAHQRNVEPIAPDHLQREALQLSAEVVRLTEA